MASAWDKQLASGPPWASAWGPGSLEDFAKFTGQTDEDVDPIEAFDWFISRNVDEKWIPHLMDSDDNDAENVRRIIRKALKKAKKGKKKKKAKLHS